MIHIRLAFIRCLMVSRNYKNRKQFTRSRTHSRTHFDVLPGSCLWDSVGGAKCVCVCVIK